MEPIRVVIVDDDPDIRMMLRVTLENEAVEIIGEAADGREGVELILRTRPSFVLMDVMMPEMSGIEATRILRREAPEVMIFGFTASGADRVREMMQAGAVAVFDKMNFGPLVERFHDLVVGAGAGR